MTSIARFVLTTVLSCAALVLPARAEPAKVVFWQFSTRPEYIEAWRQTISAFEARHPDIRVEMQVVPWAEQQQRLITALTAGGLPDVSFLGNNVVAQFQAIGALEPLDRYFAQASAAAGRDITADFWPGDRGYYFLAGHWWAAPLAVETRALYYRRDLFKAAGLDPDHPPQTWDEMLAAARKLTTGGVRGWAAPMSIDYLTLQNFMSVYLSYGGRLLDEAGTRCGADTPAFRQALATYVSAFRDGDTAPDATTLAGDRFRRGFIDGQYAMIIDQPGIWRDLQVANPSFAGDVGVAQVPAGPNGRYGFLGGWPLVLWKTSRVQDAAAQWIMFATSPEGGLVDLSVKSGMIPARRGTAAGAPWNAPPYTTFIRQMEVAYPYQHPNEPIPQMAQIEVKTIQTAIQAVAQGQKTPEAATRDLCADIDAILRRRQSR